MYKASGASGCAAALPAALLAEVLQHVPQKQRLNKCALVCRAWAPAAAQATVHVECRLQPKDIPAFEDWLTLHASQLRSLKVSSHGAKTVLQLPLHKLTVLQRLQLHCLQLQLPGEEHSSCSSSDANSGQSRNGGAGCAVQPPLPSLLHLELWGVHLVDISSLLRLTKAPQLSTLYVRNISFTKLKFDTSDKPSDSSISAAAVQQVAAAIPGLLQQLPRLSVLWLPNFPITDAATQQLASMHGLQELKLCHLEHVPQAVGNLQHLPSSVTRLELEGNCLYDRPILPPELPQLSGLRRLDLTNCAVPPQVLACFTQLQHLQLRECRLLPDDEDDEFPAEGTAALLDALSCLTRLQHLALDCQILDTVSTAPQRFSALTASSHLTELHLSRSYEAALPKGAVQHMFPPDRQLLLLQELALLTKRTADVPTKACMASADVSSIIKCCPQLHTLNIDNTVEPGADLSVLQQLPETCRSLYVAGAAFTDAAADAIGQLTQLEYLIWGLSPELTDVGLEKVVGLENLEGLTVYDSGLSEQMSNAEPGTLTLDLKIEESVSEQLDALCDLSPLLAPARLKRYKEAADEVQQLRVENDRLRKQLARSRAASKQLKQKAAGQQQ